jgi:penicillin-binding protein 1A
VIYQAKPLVACDVNCEKNQAPAPRAISAQNAYLMTSALHDVIQFGTAAQAKTIGRNDLAGKTGTTQNQVDAWFAGYNPDLVAVSWMGFDQPQSLHEYGAKAALPIWMQFISGALKNVPEHVPAQPADIVSLRINPNTGRQASDVNPNAIFEYFMKPYLPEGANADDDNPEENTAAAAASSDDNQQVDDQGDPLY